jgi:hypothetical protein
MSLLLLFPWSARKPHGGASISGGQFSRGRWRKLQDELEAKRLAAAAERDRLQRLKREAKEAKRLADAEARRQAREDAAAQADALLQGLIAAHAQQAQQAALGLQGQVQNASMMAEYAKAAAAQQEADDEEAVMVLSIL